MIKIIAAIGKNNELGRDNKLLWNLKDDLKRFKNLTEKATVIMGRKTYESLPINFRPLPNRTNIILTKNKKWKENGVKVVEDLEKVLNYIKGVDKSDLENHVWIIGGGEIYKKYFYLADELHITHVDEEFQADTYFPFIDEDLWIVKHEEEIEKDEVNSHKSIYKIYKKLN